LQFDLILFGAVMAGAVFCKEGHSSSTALNMIRSSTNATVKLIENNFRARIMPSFLMQKWLLTTSHRARSCTLLIIATAFTLVQQKTGHHP